MNKTYFIFIVIASGLFGCTSNPYNTYYNGKVNSDAHTTGHQVAIQNSANLSVDTDSLIRKGYSVLGISQFNGRTDKASQKDIMSQAKAVGADLVLVRSVYSRTETGSYALSVPNISSSQINANTNVRTNYNTYANYNTNATVNTYGSSIVNVPVNTQYSDHAAVFLKKEKVKLGISFGDVPEADKKRRQSNSGAYVARVVDNSPAFNSDILRDDIIYQVNDFKVGTPQSLKNYIEDFNGNKMHIKIDRNGNLIEKDVNIE
ncbi:PDZ domain-containing protein [Acinetobacter ursingii]|uniref:PDZ domain-containing protein n=1 Tax=Acinetobacter ursingii TaxID=108980 RepID=UPI00124DBB71|nr:PDZ domain-containing protein [Acinetobacter ursingii]